MGAVLQFAVGEERSRGKGRGDPRSIEGKRADASIGAEIVIFPGVRYERAPAHAGGIVRHARHCIERDRLELID